MHREKCEVHHINTVIIYGPQGCGKTTNAEILRDKYGCTKVLDGWNYSQPLVKGALHLTNNEPPPGMHRAQILDYSRAIST